jgi:hypothetical protein
VKCLLWNKWQFIMEHFLTLTTLMKVYSSVESQGTWNFYAFIQCAITFSMVKGLLKHRAVWLLTISNDLGM